MKRVVTLMAVALVALFIMGGCAGPKIPEGSVLRAKYQGHFHSEYSSGTFSIDVEKGRPPGTWDARKK